MNKMCDVTVFIEGRNFCTVGGINFPAFCNVISENELSVRYANNTKPNGKSISEKQIEKKYSISLKNSYPDKDKFLKACEELYKIDKLCFSIDMTFVGVRVEDDDPEKQTEDYNRKVCSNISHKLVDLRRGVASGHKSPYEIETEIEELIDYVSKCSAKVYPM